LPKFDDPNLLVGFDTCDDASAYKVNDDTAIIQTVDIFPPIVDDPYEYGQIAAANALSDVYAMGGSPKLAMNILCIPEDLPKEIIQGIMQGGYEKVAEAGAIITGGHTLKDLEPKYGLSVTGFAHPSEILTNSNAKPGDLLILTKALGTGILTTAAKTGLLDEDTYREMVGSMTALNKHAAEIMKRFPVNSCTDVTGFGLLGHAFEMASGSGSTIQLDAAEIPMLKRAVEMAETGIIPAGAYNNRDYLKGKVRISDIVPLAVSDVLFDPQTSGGLLISIPEKDGWKLLSALNDAIPLARIIGSVKEFKEYRILLK
jgi:selenide, water dikinase